MSKQDKIAWLFVLIGSALTATVPFLFYKSISGSFLPEILPQLETDSLYYLLQIKELFDGNFFLGSPYIFEHSHEKFPGLLLPIWIAAIPGLFGLSPNAIYAFNIFFYSILIGALLYAICVRVSHGRRWLAAGISVLGVASMHHLIIRPAVMQTIYPAFALFCLALYGVIKSPQQPWRYVFLGLMCVVAFYLYPYFWMVAFTAVGLLTLASLFQRKWKMFYALFFMWCGIVVFCIPQILTVISLFSDQLAMELNHRVELVETHRVMPLTLLNNKYAILALIGMGLLSLKRKLGHAEIFIILLAGGVVIGATSNLITGKEMDFHSHFWRQGLFVNVLAITVFATTFLDSKKNYERLVAGFCATIICLSTASRVVSRGNGYEYLRRYDIIAKTYNEAKEFPRVINYIKENAPGHQVVMAPPSISQYVMLYTDDYVFYMQRAAMHNISNDELRERFLTYFVGGITREFLLDEIDGYAGGGPIHASIYHNLYGAESTPLDFIGGEEFLTQVFAEHAAIQKNYEDVLRKYHVSFIVTDTLNDRNPVPPPSATEVYKDDRFTIYTLPNKMQ